MTASFGARLAGAFAAHGQLCVGIDPHSYLLGEWGLPDDANGVSEFGRRVVDAAHGAVGIVKPQIAFFERFGAAGYVALERVIADARAAGLLVIADVKRGDVGSSVAAYGEAWLSPGSPLEADAMTAVAYQGFGSLTAPLRLAEAVGKGVFVLAATSNPEAAAIQKARFLTAGAAERTVARAMIDDVDSWNARESDAGMGSDDSVAPIGSIGVVLGATIDLAEFGIDTGAALSGPALPVLAPGFGHQGAALGDARRLFGSLSAATIVSESRSVLGAGPTGIDEAIRIRASEVQDALGR